MQNPILQQLNAKNQTQQNNNIASLKRLLSIKNPQDIYNTMLQSNPQFREFVKQAEGKTIEDVAMEYDIDLNILRKFI